MPRKEDADFVHRAVLAVLVESGSAGESFRIVDRESPGRTMMRRTIRMVTLSMLGAALMLSAVAMTPRPVLSDEGRAITLYSDPATGQVFTKRCKRCVRLGEYIPAGSTEEIERKVERRVRSALDRSADSGNYQPCCFAFIKTGSSVITDSF